jgi:protein-S-isoprenylcysteine O-methyltransferase Ste14
MWEPEGVRASARLVEPALLLADPVAAHFVIPVAAGISLPHICAGTSVMLAGPLVSTAAGRAFRNAGMSVQLRGETSCLVTVGVLRHSCAPVYLGMLVWLLGLAIVLEAFIPILFPLLLFILLSTAVVPMEWRSLRQLHSAEHAGHKRRVRHWL